MDSKLQHQPPGVCCLLPLQDILPVNTGIKLGCLHEFLTYVFTSYFTSMFAPMLVPTARSGAFGYIWCRWWIILRKSSVLHYIADLTATKPEISYSGWYIDSWSSFPEKEGNIYPRDNKQIRWLGDPRTPHSMGTRYTLTLIFMNDMVHREIQGFRCFLWFSNATFCTFTVALILNHC